MKAAHVSILMAVGLAATGFGCAPTPTRYHPLNITGGYMDASVAPDEFLVEFRGNEITDAATVKDYMFYRCAELAKERGYSAFYVLGISDAPYTPPYVPGMPPPSPQPLPGQVAQIYCSKGTPQTSEKVYNVDEVIGEIGPRVLRK